jgi:hypothetical protein
MLFFSFKTVIYKNFNFFHEVSKVTEQQRFCNPFLAGRFTLVVGSVAGDGFLINLECFIFLTLALLCV